MCFVFPGAISYLYVYCILADIRLRLFKGMKVYLDNCSLNRPFDDQSNYRIRIEAEAKLYVQDLIRGGNCGISLVLYAGL